MKRLCRIAAALVYAAITYLHSAVIGAGMASLAGSAAILLMHPSRAASAADPSLFEYWIACALWCALPVIAAVRAYRNISVRRTSNTAASAGDRAEVRAPSRSASISVLGIFITAAFCAPVIANLPPLAQGDLEHTRFLPPLSAGACRTVVPIAESRINFMNEEDFLGRAVAGANNYLLHRTVVFSGTEGGRASSGADSRVIFLFGTDAVGRDIFSRVVYGARYSIGIGFVVVFFSVLIGSCIGMAAGYRGGILDAAFMRTIDVLMSVPTLFLVLTLMAMLGQSVAAMIIVLTATEWMGVARIVRGETMHLRSREFISASRLLGASTAGILRTHVLPNVRPTITYAAVLQLGNIFLAEASLSFLGLGIQAPNPSWGNMIAESMGHLNAGISAGIFPGVALSALIVTVHVIGAQDQ
jgi:peptide/nickel transport system permease protein